MGEEERRLKVRVLITWGERWYVIAVPTIRTTVESGAPLEDGLSGGGFVGAGYRVNDRLSIGPGVGVLTQLEDSTRVIPILVINWKITDDLSLNTGRGTGATLGPGLTLDWRLSRAWSFSLGGRYERLRFRLDKNGTVSNGIGEDRSCPIFGGIGYRFTPSVRISVLGGVEVGGELRLEDEKGRTASNNGCAGSVLSKIRAKFI